MFWNVDFYGIRCCFEILQNVILSCKRDVNVSGIYEELQEYLEKLSEGFLFYEYFCETLT